MKIGYEIKKRRMLLGMTQQELAQKAEISLAMLQNIETKEANLSLQILDKIFKPLHLEYHVTESHYDWDILCQLGLPIYAQKIDKEVSNTKEALIENIKLGCLQLIDKPNDRLKLSMESLLLAIKIHYPTLYKRKLGKISYIRDHFTLKKITGPHIKLKRLALAKIGQYL